MTCSTSPIKSYNLQSILSITLQAAHCTIQSQLEAAHRALRIKICHFQTQLTKLSICRFCPSLTGATGGYTVFCQMLPYIGIKSADLHSLLSENHEVMEWFGLEGALKFI